MLMSTAEAPRHIRKKAMVTPKNQSLLPITNAADYIKRVFIFIFTVLTLATGSSGAECPSQCQCVPNRMSCETPGLRHLPPPYTSQLESLLVENQTFASTHLGPAELKVYQTPEFGGQVRLKNLHIRYCNIRTIERQAFHEIGSKLEILDLSGNPLKHIADYAFAGLGQLTLILDRMDQPMFDDNAFANLSKMKSLFIQNSKLAALPYEALLRLTTNGRLDNLLIGGNQLRSLDQRFEVIFQSLQYFNINDNPWECDCQLNWLIRRYQMIVSDRADFERSRNHRWGESVQPRGWSQHDSQPQCASPIVLYGRNFSDLITDIGDIYSTAIVYSKRFSPPTIIHCPPPQLESFDIDLDEYTPSEKSRPAIKKGKLIVRLKCVMKGSNQLFVSWQYHDPMRGLQSVSSSNITKAGNTTLIGPSRWSSRSGEAQRTESNVYLEQREQADIYSCLGQDVIGNVSTLVRIKWPDIPVRFPQTAQVTLPPPVNNNRETETALWNARVLAPSHSLLHTPQFSLSQLLSAIAGTFFSTIILFFLVHCALHRRFAFCERRKRSHQAHHTHKVEVRNAACSGASPGETSSSSTSFSNAKLISPKVGESYLNGFPSHMGSEAFPVASNLASNPHTYHQMLNGQAIIAAHTGIPVELATPTVRQSDRHLTYQANLFPDGACASSAGAAYEPVSYSDANNLTYDVPWMLNRPDGLPNKMNTEQHIPLLFNGMFNDKSGSNNNVNYPVDFNALSHSGLIHSALMIPPPPSIPQPSLPSTPNSLNLTGTLNRNPSSTTNLLILQATGYPANHSAVVNKGGYTTTGAVNPTSQ